MKFIQFIDGAENASYSIFAVTNADYKAVFPERGQNIEFVEDVVERLDPADAAALLARVSTHMVSKSQVPGIHGTLFFGLPEKRRWYPSKRESDLWEDRSVPQPKAKKSR